MTPAHLRSELLSVPHGFFGRDGGVSTGDVAGLNAGFGADDARQNVIENRHRVGQALGAAFVTTAHQFHSAIAAYVRTPSQGDIKADGLITDQPGLALGVLAADCVPILFCAEGWVGAAHAGWRGSLGGIAEATIALFRAQGVAPESLRCALGPSLRSPLFEVGEDLIQAVTEPFPEAERFFATTRPGKADFDHIGFVRWRLENAGLLPEHIDDVGGNTLAHPDRWFSYRASRRDGHNSYGRNISAIVLP